uniref:Uncharacterized protein n=1 Tax=Kalanchoe fedtschenkoi TaxID=63787 RepID=A0A7N0RGE7_KALFE
MQDDTKRQKYRTPNTTKPRKYAYKETETIASTPIINGKKLHSPLNLKFQRVPSAKRFKVAAYPQLQAYSRIQTIPFQ